MIFKSRKKSKAQPVTNPAVQAQELDDKDLEDVVGGAGARVPTVLQGRKAGSLKHPGGDGKRNIVHTDEGETI